MTSKIDPSRDGYVKLYPVAGVNNSSQGFRNNFTSLHGNLLIVKDEITNLHNKEIRLFGDVVATSNPRLVIDGSEAQPVEIELKIRDNVTLPGMAGITVPRGTTTDRPSSPELGTIRFNTTTGKMEFFTGTWAEIGGQGGSYVSTSGDIVKGSIVMSGQGEVAQVLADNSYDVQAPSLSFSGDEDTGFARPTDGVIDAISNGVVKMTIGDTVSFPSGLTTSSLQYRGAKMVYFQLLNRPVSSWATLASWDCPAAQMMRFASMTVTYLHTGMDYSNARGFSTTGTRKVSMIYSRLSAAPSPAPTLTVGITAGDEQTTLLNALTADVDFRLIYQSDKIFLQARGGNDYGGGLTSAWNLTGSIEVLFNQLGDLPLTVIYD